MKKSHVKLKTISDVNRLLGRLINEVRNGEIEANVASKIAYIANVLIGGLKDGDIADRLSKLEKLVEEIKK